MNIFIYLNFGLCVLQLCATQHILRPVFMKQSALKANINKGEIAKLGDMPYQVSFKLQVGEASEKVKQNNKGWESYLYFTFCGGTIIREDKILSATNCFVLDNTWSSCYKSKVLNKITSYVRAVAGSVNYYGIENTRFTEGLGLRTHEMALSSKNEKAQWRELKIIIYPNKLTYPYYHDIAVVILKTPFIFNSVVDRIGYASSFRDYRGKCLYSWYGMLNETFPAEYLYKTNVDVWTNYWCCMSFYRNMKEFICSGFVTSTIQPRDFGGPLVCRGTGDKNEGPYGLLVGITIRYTPGRGGVFTRVSAFHDYITNNRAPQSYTSNCFMGSVVLFSVYGIYSKLIVVMTP